MASQENDTNDIQKDRDQSEKEKPVKMKNKTDENCKLQGTELNKGKIPTSNIPNGITMPTEHSETSPHVVNGHIDTNGPNGDERDCNVHIGIQNLQESSVNGPSNHLIRSNTNTLHTSNDSQHIEPAKQIPPMPTCRNIAESSSRLCSVYHTQQNPVKNSKRWDCCAIDCGRVVDFNTLFCQESSQDAKKVKNDKLMEFLTGLPPLISEELRVEYLLTYGEYLRKYGLRYNNAKDLWYLPPCSRTCESCNRIQCQSEISNPGDAMNSYLNDNAHLLESNEFQITRPLVNGSNVHMRLQEDPPSRQIGASIQATREGVEHGCQSPIQDDNPTLYNKQFNSQNNQDTSDSKAELYPDRKFSEADIDNRTCKDTVLDFQCHNTPDTAQCYSTPDSPPPPFHTVINDNEVQEDEGDFIEVDILNTPNNDFSDSDSVNSEGIGGSPSSANHCHSNMVAQNEAVSLRNSPIQRLNVQPALDDGFDDTVDKISDKDSNYSDTNCDRLSPVQGDENLENDMNSNSENFESNREDSEPYRDNIDQDGNSSMKLHLKGTSQNLPEASCCRTPDSLYFSPMDFMEFDIDPGSGLFNSTDSDRESLLDRLDDLQPTAKQVPVENDSHNNAVRETIKLEDDVDGASPEPEGASGENQEYITLDLSTEPAPTNNLDEAYMIPRPGHFHEYFNVSCTSVEDNASPSHVYPRFAWDTSCDPSGPNDNSTERIDRERLHFMLEMQREHRHRSSPHLSHEVPSSVNHLHFPHQREPQLCVERENNATLPWSNDQQSSQDLCAGGLSPNNPVSTHDPMSLPPTEFFPYPYGYYRHTNIGRSLTFPVSRRLLPGGRRDGFERSRTLDGYMSSAVPVEQMENMVLTGEYSNSSSSLRTETDEEQNHDQNEADAAVAQTEPPVERVMIWSELIAYVRQAKQIGTSACGPTAVINILKAFNLEIEKDLVCTNCRLKLRKEGWPLPEYLHSRSEAGTTAEDLTNAIYKLTDGQIVGRFFSFYPLRDVHILKWLGEWMKLGAVPLATLNLQKAVPPGWIIPDAWHHQMVYGVAHDGVYLTNPLDVASEERISRQLCSNSVLMIRRNDILTRYHEDIDLGDLMSFPDERWRELNVLGQVVNVIREHNTQRLPGFRPTLTSHITIPAAYRAGITLFVKKDSDVYKELMEAEELPLKDHENADHG
ncbi:unnamed protein product [Owenia fusiformis]|uniref:Uncharacterized protein n=1 Tax=Owenia fusiformis TaxID=6347 RepID=A0A8J1UU77_OWEFU|nr:unnamed protein product [Owenia fusiformis]